MKITYDIAKSMPMATVATKIIFSFHLRMLHPVPVNFIFSSTI